MLYRTKLLTNSWNTLLSKFFRIYTCLNLLNIFRTASTNEELPIVWHRTFQLFVESYANDLSAGQLTLLQLVIKEKNHHYAISPIVLGRLREAEEKLEKEGDTKMEIEA